MRSGPLLTLAAASAPGPATPTLNNSLSSSISAFSELVCVGRYDTEACVESAVGLGVEDTCTSCSGDKSPEINCENSRSSSKSRSTSILACSRENSSTFGSSGISNGAVSSRSASVSANPETSSTFSRSSVRSTGSSVAISSAKSGGVELS